MKKTLLLAAALVCTGAVAQEKDVWACQGLNSNGFVWEDGKWVRGGYAPDNWLLSLDGNDSNIKVGDIDYPLRCTDILAVMCISDWGVYVTFDRVLSTGSVAVTLGSALSGPNGERDSIYIEPLQCTKF